LGYLILFPFLTFVSQRQSLWEKCLHLLVFPLIFKDLIPTLSIIRFNLLMILASINILFNLYISITVVNLNRNAFKAAYTPFTPDNCD